MKKKRDFQYYYPNRDYGDHLEHLTLKKVDNGEYWDNGYKWIRICLYVFLIIN